MKLLLQPLTSLSTIDLVGPLSLIDGFGFVLNIFIWRAVVETAHAAGRLVLHFVSEKTALFCFLVQLLRQTNKMTEWQTSQSDRITSALTDATNKHS